MNLDMNQHETYITAPDDAAKVVRDAIPPPAQPNAVIPGPTDDATSVPPHRRRPAEHRGKLYGMPLAWRGLRVLGVAFGIAAVWFLAAWVRHGEMPLGLSPAPRLDSHQSPVLPPMWMIAILGLMVAISICVMLLGTQDVSPKMKFKKDE